MRKRGSGAQNSKTVGNIARFLIFILCLVVVFGFTLTAEAFTVGFSGDSLQIAAAGKSDQSTGNSVAVYGNRGGLNASHFGFPGPVGSSSYSLTESFSNVVFDPQTNISAYKNSDTGANLTLNGGTGQFSFGMDAYSSYGYSLYAVFNYQISPFLSNLISKNDFVKVNATLTATMSSNRGNKSGLKAIAANKNMTATDINGDGEGQFSTADQNTYTANSTAELTKEKPYLALAFLRGGALQALGDGTQVTVSNISIKFDISFVGGAGSGETALTEIQDGRAPELKDIKADPKRTEDSLPSEWPVYNDNAAGIIDRNFDDVDIKNLNQKLYSFTNKPAGQINNKNYYKTAEMSFADVYNYSSGVTGDIAEDVYANASGSGIDLRYFAGIKKIRIGDAGSNLNSATENGAVFYAYESLASDGAKAGKPVWVNGQEVGYAEVTRVNRAFFQIKVYFYQNVQNVQVVVSDYGDNASIAQKLDVKGIDTLAPTAPQFEMNEYITSAPANILLRTMYWISSRYYGVDVRSLGADFDNADEYAEALADKTRGYTPYLWFFDVAKTEDGNFDGLPLSSFTYEQLKNAIPFAAGNLNAFTYNYYEGNAGYYTVGQQRLPILPLSKQLDPSDNTQTTGAGYYRFSIYTMDLAGNVCAEHTVFYSKADYEEPTNEISLSYGNGNYVLPEQNGAWVNNALTLSLTLLKGPSFSGNTVTFYIDFDGQPEEYSVSLYGNKIVSIKKDGAFLPLADGGVLSFLIEKGLMFEYSVKDGQAVFSITFASDKTNVGGAERYRDFDYFTQFTVTTGIDAEAESLVTSRDLRWINPADGSNAVGIRVDRNAPEGMEIEQADQDAGNFISQTENAGSIPFDQSGEFSLNGRSWYTEDWFMDVFVTFGGDKIAEYGDAIKLYIGLKTATVKSDLNNFGRFGASYHGFDYSTFGNGAANDEAKNYFDNVITIKGSEIASGLAARQLNLLQEKSAGLRVLYAWGVDQAGNVGQFSCYYLLSDATQYTVRAVPDSDYIEALPQSGVSIDAKNGTTETTRFRRGDVLNLSFGLGGSYVPYKLTKTVGGASEDYLKNTTTQSLFTVAAGKELLAQADGMTASISIDDVSLAMLGMGEIIFKFSFRRVVDYSVAATSVEYSGTNTVPPITMKAVDEPARSSFIYTFTTPEGQTVSPAPVVPGDYRLTVTLNTPYYIAKELKNKEYKIINRKASVTVSNLEEFYGYVHELTYKIDGLTEIDEAKFKQGGIGAISGARGSVKLKNSTVSDLKLLDIGTYAVVENESDPFSIEYYDVTFTGGTLKILPRPIDVIIKKAALNANLFTKVYGDPDGSFGFALNTAQLADREKALFANGSYSFFVNATKKSSVGELCYFEGLNVVNREAGEDTGIYSFITDRHNLVYDLNYVINLSVDPETKFEIKKRNIVIETTDGQSVVAVESNLTGTGENRKPSDEYLDSLHVNYKFTNSADNNFRGMLNIAFVFDKESVVYTKDGDFDVWTYTLTLQASEREQGKNNFDFGQKDEGKYTFIIRFSAEKKFVLVEKKPDKVFSQVYGEYFDRNIVAFNPDFFNIKVVGPNEAGWVFNLTWNASINYVGEFPDSAAYPVQLSDIALTITDAQGNTVTADADGNPVSAADYIVEVKTFGIEILPFELKVIPTFVKINKTYGLVDWDENAYGIGYNFSNDPAELEKFRDLSAVVSGSFVRGIYAADGTLLTYGTRYDPVTDSFGVTLDGTGRYYAPAVGLKFTARSSNFNVSVDENYIYSGTGKPIMSSLRFCVDPIVIDLTEKMFVGKSKYYDGTAAAHYEIGEAADISALRARMTDEVYVDFDAEYDSKEAGKTRSIIFRDLRLSGADCFNYTLTLNGNALIVGDTVTIFYINNDPSVPEEQRGRIEIYKVTALTLSKDDFYISKQYDGTTALSIEHVSIRNPQLDSLKAKYLYGTVSFQQSAASDSPLSVGSIRIFFEVEGAKDNWNITVPDNQGISVDVNATYNGKNGILVTLQNMPAYIQRRLITPESLDSISAADRMYDATDSVSVSFNFKSGALAFGDSGSSVGLSIKASVNDKNASPLRKNVIFDEVTVDNSNYTVNVADFKNAFEREGKWLTVLIERVVLIPDLNFGLNPNKEYDGKEELIKGTDVTSSGKISPLAPASADNTALINELNNFRFDFQNARLFYSIDGVIDPFVAFDEQGNVKLHDVKFEGVKIGYNGIGGIVAITGEELINLIRNYAFADGAPMTLDANGFITTPENKDTFIQNIAPLNPKTVVVYDNYITVEDKAYDGTAEAVVKADIEAGAIVEGDPVELDIRGFFSSEHVSYNRKTGDVLAQKVTVVSEGFKNKAGADKDYARNYKLSEKISIPLSAKILPAPIGVTIDLGEKTYDGSPTVDVNSIVRGSRRLDESDFVSAADRNRYNVAVTQAGYTDKNVARGANGEVLGKDGAAFGLKLNNTYNRDIIDYALCHKTATEIPEVTPYATKTLGGVTYYYYLLETADKYIKISDYDALSEQDRAGYTVIGSYTIYINNSNNTVVRENVYILSAAPESAANIGTLDNPVNYITASGTIAPKQIKISVSKIDVEGSDPYIKDYDGTNKFTGVAGVNYQIDSQNIGTVRGDIVTIGEHEAYFEQSNAGSTKVIFNVTGIGGEDSSNYSYEGSTSYIPGAIRKISMSAKLNDTSVVYGERIGELKNISYAFKAADKSFEVIAALYDGRDALFMTVQDFFEAFPEVNREDLNNKHFYNTLYNVTDENGILKAVQEAAGRQNVADENLKFIKLAGQVSLPQGKATIGTLTPVGDYNYVMTGGSSTNFTFAAEYTDTTQGCSKITVVRAEIYIYAAGTHTKVFGESSPAIEFGFSAGRDSDANGLKNGDKPENVFGADFFKAYYRLFDGTGWTGAEIADNALLPQDLGEGSFYGAYIYSENGEIGAEGIAVGNYVVKLRYDNSEGYGYIRLDITLPELTGVYALNKSYDYNADPEAYKQAIYGLAESDSVTELKFSQWNNNEFIEMAAGEKPVNAGKYKVEFTVERPLANSPEGKSYNYQPYKGTFELVINKATAGIYAKDLVLLFNFNHHTFDKSAIKFANETVNPLIDDIKVTYYWGDDASTAKKTDDMYNAGNYLIKLTFDPAAADNMTPDATNFEAETAEVYYYVKPVEIDIHVDESSLRQVFVDSETTNVKFRATIAQEFADVGVTQMPELEAAYLGLGSAGQSQYVKVTGPGIYKFRIKPVNESAEGIGNYTIVGGTGEFTVGYNSIVAQHDGNTFASLSVPNNEIVVAQKLIYKEIFSENPGNLSYDNYWRTVERFMPTIGGGKTQASLQSIVMLSMTYNNASHNVDTTVEMKVALPNAVKSLKDMVVYTVTKDGGLQKLDYTYSDGFINYSTDFISPLVFVKLGNPLPAWGIALIVIGSLAGAAGIVVAILAGLKLKRKKIVK